MLYPKSLYTRPRPNLPHYYNKPTTLDSDYQRKIASPKIYYIEQKSAIIVLDTTPQLTG